MIKAAILTLAAMASTMAQAQTIDAAKANQIEKQVERARRQLPMQVDTTTTLHQIALVRDSIVYTYSLQADRYQLWDMYPDLQAKAIAQNCKDAHTRQHLDAGLTLRHEFNDSQRRKGVRVVVTIEDCQKGPQA